MLLLFVYSSIKADVESLKIPNQKLYIEGQTYNGKKRQTNNDIQNTTQKKRLCPTKTGDEIRCSVRISSCSSTSGTLSCYSCPKSGGR